MCEYNYDRILSNEDIWCLQGSPGPRGFTGATGLPGMQGPPGVNGPKGEKGDEGSNVSGHFSSCSISKKCYVSIMIVSK